MEKEVDYKMMSITCGEEWVSGGVCVRVSVLECV